MRLKTRVLLAIGCVSLLAMSIPAFSVPAPRGLEQQRNIQKKKIAQPAPAGRAKPQAARENHAARLVSMPIADPPKRPMFGWPALVSEARKYIGTNPTARTKLWCATFMNLVLAKIGYAGTNSDAAKSFADYGRRISEPQVGAIAVLTRGKSGGHVGVVTGIDSHGNPIIISGNHGRHVGEAVYSRARVIAYVMPSERGPVSEVKVAERAMPSMTNTLSAASRAPSEPSIESPIAELLAAIETEKTRSEVNARPAPPMEPPTLHRAVQQTPERVQQVAQQPVRRPMRRPVQLAQQPLQHPVQQAAPPARRDLRRDLPLDPALVKLFGIKARAQAVPPPRLTPQRQQPIQQRPGHVARADIGPAGRQSVQR